MGNVCALSADDARSARKTRRCPTTRAEQVEGVAQSSKQLSRESPGAPTAGHARLTPPVPFDPRGEQAGFAPRQLVPALPRGRSPHSGRAGAPLPVGPMTAIRGPLHRAFPSPTGGCGEVGVEASRAAGPRRRTCHTLSRQPRIPQALPRLLDSRVGNEPPTGSLGQIYALGKRNKREDGIITPNRETPSAYVSPA